MGHKYCNLCSFSNLLIFEHFVKRKTTSFDIGGKNKDWYLHKKNLCSIFVTSDRLVENLGLDHIWSSLFFIYI